MRLPIRGARRLLHLPILAAVALTPFVTPPKIAQAPSQRWLAVTSRALAAGTGDEAISAAWDAVTAARAAAGGHVRSWAGRRVDQAQVTLRVDVWDSLEAAEDASLALDGSDALAALAKLTDSSGSNTIWMRQLRSKRYPDKAGTAGHLEVTVFRTRKGQSRAGNLALFDQAEKGFTDADGLLAHSLWLAPDGRWAHVLEWRSEEDFQKTSKALMRNDGVSGWIRSLDFRRFQTLRADLLD